MFVNADFDDLVVLCLGWVSEEKNLEELAYGRTGTRTQ
jgi:hypothetical protein